MKEITFFRTVSFGGIEGKTREVRNFETEEMAKEDAKIDEWNDDFSMYKITMIFNGIITEKKEYMGEIFSRGDAMMVANEEEYINRMIKEIETLKNNKKIKETTRIKKIKDIEEKIERERKYIKKLQEKIR